MSTVMVTGGAGYKGCVLVPKLLAVGHKVVVYDLGLFGFKGLIPQQDLAVIPGDIRNTEHFEDSLKYYNCDSVIHLACISNDPSCELNPELTKSINYDCFEPLVQASVRQRIKRFIFASSSSVYGISDASEVTEDHPLVPITDYNKYKAMCEKILFKYQSPDFTTVSIRPATVAGYSPRMRLDLLVNIFTNQAYNKREITVFGGLQERPVIHIDDITDLYVHLLTIPVEKIAGQAFNAGSEYNFPAISWSSLVSRNVSKFLNIEQTDISIKVEKSNDIRSYRISNKKIRKVLDWNPMRSIREAVIDMCQAFKQGKIPNSLTDDKYHNVKVLKKSGLR